jgi:phage tail sheath protein FI
LKQPLLTEIETGLKKIMDDYRNKPSAEATWTNIKNEANSLLYGYFRNQKLAGNKPQEAYYIQIGAQTMTAADIAANRKILVAGVAVTKPAEFMMITVESLPKRGSSKNDLPGN